MASFTLFGGSTTARSLVSGETGFIGAQGALAVTGDAITTTTGSSVDIVALGGLHSSAGNAIDMAGSALDLFVGQNGALGTAQQDGLLARFSAYVFVSNQGDMYSGDDAIDARVSDSGGSIKINNHGTIAGKSDAIVTSSGTSDTRIVNFGDITGGFGGIDHLDGVAVVINRGSISGQSYGFDGSDDKDTLRNFGSVDGGVITRGGADVVVNRGEIDFVQLGEGADIYKGRGGHVEDWVDGQAGADILRGGRFDDQMRGSLGDDTLYGRNGDDELRGGAGNDTVFGQRGDDDLRGGGGADVFVFAAKGGFDTVHDLQSADKIDLSRMGMLNYATDVQPNVFDAAGGVLIDLDADYDLQIFLKGVSVASITASDFIF